MARELKFSRAVFALRSHHLGGFSKWKILSDRSLKKLRPFYKKQPKIVAGVLKHEALEMFKKIGYDKYFLK